MDYLVDQSQPPVYVPPSTDNQKLILWLVALFVFLLFVFAYWRSLNLRIILSYYDIYKNVHFEKFLTSEGIEIEKENTYKPNQLGGFCTMITIIALLAISCSTVIEYAYTNVVQDIILVPSGSLAEEHDFTNIEFTMEVTFSSYRGDCTNASVTSSTPDYIPISYILFQEDSPLCRYSATFGMQGEFAGESPIILNFNQFSSYSSDITFKLSVDSSVPGYTSSVISQVFSDSGMVFRGSTPTVFYYSMLASYYEEKSQFSSTISNTGYLISENTQISQGSQSPAESIPLSTGLRVGAFITVNDIGISTYKYPQIDLFALMLNVVSDLPGTIVLIGILMWFVEYALHLAKGQSSGRFRLARKAIEEEKNKRSERKRLIATDKDPLLDDKTQPIN